MQTSLFVTLGNHSFIQKDFPIRGSQGRDYSVCVFTHVCSGPWQNLNPVHISCVKYAMMMELLFVFLGLQDGTPCNLTLLPQEPGNKAALWEPNKKINIREKWSQLKEGPH